jgi:hypothetical protein
MKSKVKQQIEVSEAGKLFTILPGETVQATEPGTRDIWKKWKTFNRSHPEEFIQAEFDIDSETMEEHLQELLVYMMQNHMTGKITQD